MHMILTKPIPYLTVVIFFFFRNINTIRSIARGHGDPVDRYKIMARCATQGAFAVSPEAPFSTKVKGLKERVHFEFKLW